MATRVITVEDGSAWLRSNKGKGPVVVMLPDAAEVNMGLSEWALYFHKWAADCLGASSGPVVFAQTDRRVDGRWVSKAKVIMNLAERRDKDLLWHKIALRRGVGRVDLHRPGFTHVLAFGPGRPGRATPDVFESGRYLWRNGMGVDVARMIVRWLGEVAPDGPVVNPFCGRGTLVAACVASGRDVIGCDLDAANAEAARVCVLGS